MPDDRPHLDPLGGIPAMMGVDANGIERLIRVDGSGNLVTAIGTVAGTDVTTSAVLATNTAGSVTLPGVANKTTYIAGFTVSVLNGTVGPSGLITLTGVISGTMNYHLSGGANGIFISVQFTRPIPASAVNTGIVVNVPAFGATSGAVAISAHGYQL